MRGYLVVPANAKGKLPTVLVVHENRGLNPHIEDIARRLAVDGFIAFAPDALFPLGGYPGDEDKARELFPKLDQAKTREDFVAATAALKTLPQGNGKVGVVGFCYGGGIANFLATRVVDLAAAVPFYGGQPADEESRRHCCCIMRVRMSGLTLAGQNMKQRLKRPRWIIRPMFTRMCSMALTMIRRHVMTRSLQGWHGRERYSFFVSAWPDHFPVAISV